MSKSTKKFVIRLYANHDIDLLALSYNPSVSFSKVALAAIRGYVRNIPVGDGWSFGSPVHLEVPGKITSRQYTIYLDTQADADVIDYLNSVSSINGVLRYAIRYYLRSSQTPGSDITKTLYSLPVSDIKAPMPISSEQKITIQHPEQPPVYNEEKTPEPPEAPEEQSPVESPQENHKEVPPEVPQEIDEEFQSKKNPTEGFGENLMALFGAGF